MNARVYRTRFICGLVVALFIAVGLPEAQAGSGEVDIYEHAHGPAWSPDGRWIAYTHSFGWDNNETGDIAVVPAGGGPERSITGSSYVVAEGAAWSPDGRKIAYTLDDYGEGSFYVEVAEADGSGVVRLTTTGSDYAPAWSPDGRTIAFMSSRGHHAQVFTMSGDGSAQTRLTNDSYGVRDFAWSPDGTRIAYSAGRPPQIFTMNVDGTAQTRVTNNRYGAVAPAWSPDTTRIAYVGGRRAGAAGFIDVINPDGSGHARLTRHSGFTGPVWSPDGRKIVSGWVDKWSDREIYVVNANGSGLFRVGRKGELDDSPTWSPDSSKIAFVNYGRRPTYDIFIADAQGKHERRLTLVGCTIIGSPGDDRLVGTRGGDVLCGLGGNDVLLGRGGPDELNGGPGNDILRAGNGHDVIEGETGNDTIFARDKRRDTVYGGPGRDRAQADRHLDHLYGVERRF